MQLFTQRLDTSHWGAELQSELQAKLAHQQQRGFYLSLDYDTRQRSRFKAITESGEEIGVDLPRTETLKDGCVLLLGSLENPAQALVECTLIQVMASPQRLTKVSADGGFQLMRAAYHLGNRHVPLMVTPEALYLEPDHVLSDMLTRLGVRVTEVDAPFEPETGAYQGGHSQGHTHDHSHEHPHQHSHNHASNHVPHSHSSSDLDKSLSNSND